MSSEFPSLLFDFSWQVTQYLTTEFYSLNYSLRQRLDVLEVKVLFSTFTRRIVERVTELLPLYQVLVFAARELSRPITGKTDPSVGSAAAASSDSSPYISDKPADWRQEVEKRIQSKTRRLRKVPAADLRLCLLMLLKRSSSIIFSLFQGATQPAPEATPNRYAPVAGHFFFPLLRNYDKYVLSQQIQQVFCTSILYRS